MSRREDECDDARWEGLFKSMAEHLASGSSLFRRQLYVGGRDTAEGSEAQRVSPRRMALTVTH